MGGGHKPLQYRAAQEALSARYTGNMTDGTHAAVSLRTEEFRSGANFACATGGARWLKIPVGGFTAAFIEILLYCTVLYCNLKDPFGLREVPARVPPEVCSVGRLCGTRVRGVR